MPPWTNPWLMGAMGLSMSLHFVILYVDVLAVSEHILVFLFLHRRKIEEKIPDFFHFKNFFAVSDFFKFFQG
jgi:hypothetical protein